MPYIRAAASQLPLAVQRLEPYTQSAACHCVPGDKDCRSIWKPRSEHPCQRFRNMPCVWQAVPYIRAAASQLPLAVQRLEQVSQALPQAWLHNQAAAGLLEVCKALARSMERSSKLSSQVCGQILQQQACRVSGGLTRPCESAAV